MRKRGQVMNKKIEELFNISYNERDYAVADQILEMEISKILKSYEEQLPPNEYEKVRDILFSVSFIAKKQSFEVGFKVAVNIMADCFRQE